VDPALDRVLKRCTKGAPWTSVPVGVNDVDVAKHIPMATHFDMENWKYNDT
jgi:hypothetical protein